MRPDLPELLILAEPATAFRELYGISMIERLLRTVQRLGFTQATVLCTEERTLAAHLATPSWARAEVTVKFLQQSGVHATVGDVASGITSETQRCLLVSGGYYYDARLLAALAERTETTILIDSQPPDEALGASRAACALLSRDWLAQQPETAVLHEQLSLGDLARCDAAEMPGYVVDMRKLVRPVFFPAPSPELMPRAMCVLRGAAQKGTLDFPAAVFDPPVQDRIVRWLSRTGVRPNHITLCTGVLALIVTVLFASGKLWLGVLLAYLVEVFDGVDGKLARTKVETSAAGDWEHVSDYFLELSWWAALAFHFQNTGLRSAWAFFVLLVASDWIDKLARSFVKRTRQRDIDDISNFDRFMRCIGPRRNINIWILIAGLLLADPANAFVLMCTWTAVTAAVHVVRAAQLHARAA